MTKSDAIAWAFIAVIVFVLGWIKDRVFGEPGRRPSLRTRMYLQARKERKQRDARVKLGH